MSKSALIPSIVDQKKLCILGVQLLVHCKLEVITHCDKKQVLVQKLNLNFHP